MSNTQQRQITDADFTPEINEEIKKLQKIAIDELENGTEYSNWKYENTVEYINYVLKLSDQGKRVILIANNPIEYDKMFYVLFSDDFMDEAQIPTRDLYNHMMANPEEDHTEAMKALSAKVLGQEIKTRLNLDTLYHWSGLLSEYSRAYLMWHQVLAYQFNQANENQKDLDWLWANVRQASILKVYITEMVILVVRMPKEIHRNELGFHNAKGLAIDHNGYGKYYINGRPMSDDIFNKFFEGTLTFEEWNAITSEDVRAGVITCIRETQGEEGVLKFLGATLIDEIDVEHHNRVEYKVNLTESDIATLENLYPGRDVVQMVTYSVDEAFDKFKTEVVSNYTENLQLYRTTKTFPFAMDRDKKLGAALAWVRFLCPSTGSTYLISTCPKFDKALDAAKFCRPAAIPTEFPYKWVSAN